MGHFLILDVGVELPCNRGSSGEISLRRYLRRIPPKVRAMSAKIVSTHIAVTF